MNAIRALVLLAVAAQVAAAQSFSIEQIMSAPFATGLVAAPTGQRIAWVASERGKRNIWVADAPGFKARRVTAYVKDDGQDVGDLAFSADGRRIVYVRGGPKNQAGEIPNPTSDPAGAEQAVWVVNATGAAAPVKLGEGASPAVAQVGNRVAFLKDGQVWSASLAPTPTKARQLFKARGTANSLQWSPDGSRLAFVSSRGTHSLISVYDTRTNVLRFIAPSVDRDMEPRWSPDGKRLAFIRLATAGAGGGGFGGDGSRDLRWSIWIGEAASGEARMLWQAPPRAGGSFSSLAGDAVLQWAAGDRLAFTAELDGWNRIYSIAAAGGEPVALSAESCEVEEAQLTPDRRNLLFASNCGDINRRHLARVAVAEGPPSSLTSGSGIEYSPRVLGDGRTVAYFASDAFRPAAPRVLALDGSGKPHDVSGPTAPEFPKTGMVEPQAVTFKAADGLEIHGQLFLPAARAGRMPAVIFTHGGPQRQMYVGWHSRHYYHNAYAFNQYLASRGYVVLSVNYRGGIGYGRAFRNAPGRGGRGASEYQDVLAAVHYLRGRSDVDAARVGKWGGSYGGYLTALALARNSDLFAAGVDLHGVHDWSAFRSSSLLPRDSDATKLARDSSPVASVRTWRSPVLLIHGDDDRNVQFAQTVELAARLRQQGVAFEQLIYPDEVHDFLRHERWVESYRAAAAFFDKHLKGTATR